MNTSIPHLAGGGHNQQTREGGKREREKRGGGRVRGRGKERGRKAVK